MTIRLGAGGGTVFLAVFFAAVLVSGKRWDGFVGLVLARLGVYIELLGGGGAFTNAWWAPQKIVCDIGRELQLGKQQEISALEPWELRFILLEISCLVLP
jgi:hypothetical protein